jgi:hypothetical protein
VISYFQKDKSFLGVCPFGFYSIFNEQDKNYEIRKTFAKIKETEKYKKIHNELMEIINR